MPEDGESGGDNDSEESAKNLIKEKHGRIFWPKEVD